MAKSTALNIDHVANLARIALTDEEKQKYAQQLGDVLHHIEQLEKIDVAGVEPTAHAYPVFNVWAEDTVSSPMPVERLLRNAPAHRDHLVVVPKVVE